MVEEPRQGRVYSTLVAMTDPDTGETLASQDALFVFSSKGKDVWTFFVYESGMDQPRIVSLRLDFMQFLRPELKINMEQVRARVRH